MKTKVYLLPFLLFSISVSASTTWVAKTSDTEISKQQIQHYLSFQQATLEQVPSDKRKQLLENWFIRESLAKTATKEKLEESSEYQQAIQEFKQDLLAKLALAELSKKKMPDFTERAEEIYKSEKAQKYHHPTLLQVKQIYLKPEKTELAKKIQRDIKQGKLDIDAAIKQYSIEPQKYRSKGLSYWFHKGQKSASFYQQAEKLSKAKPLSPVFKDGDQLLILYFMGKKPETITPFKDVKDKIIAQLKHDYIDTERALIIDKIKQDFANNITINPEFLKN